MRFKNLYAIVFGDIHSRSHQISQISCLILGIFLIIHATFRGEYADLDALAYIDWYESFRDLNLVGFIDGMSNGIYFDTYKPYKFELGFAALTFLCMQMGFGIEGFFFVCAATSILPKVFIISRYSLSPFLAMIWYTSWYYILFEMNAIRAGLASAVLIMGLRQILTGNALRLIPYIFFGSLFHISAIAGFLLIFVNWIKVDTRLYIALIAGSIVLSFFSFVTVFNFLGEFNTKIYLHLNLMHEDPIYSTINVFNTVTLKHLAILFALLLYYHKSPNRWSNVEQFGLWSMVLSLVIYFSFASFPVVADRLCQFIGMFQIFVTAALLRGFKPKLIPKFVFALLIIIQFYAVVFYSRLADFFYFTNISWLRFPLAVHQ